MTQPAPTASAPTVSFLPNSPSKLASVLKHYRLDTNRNRLYRVEQVANRLARVTDESWSVFVVRNFEPSAIVTQQNELLVSSKLIDSLVTESSLASVLSHELAHIVLGHTDESQVNLENVEFDADRTGLFLMADAGFDPVRALELWQSRLKSPSASDTRPEVLGFEPITKARLEKLQASLPEAIKRYRQARRTVR